MLSPALDQTGQTDLLAPSLALDQTGQTDLLAPSLALDQTGQTDLDRYLLARSLHCRGGEDMRSTHTHSAPPLSPVKAPARFQHCRDKEGEGLRSTHSHSTQPFHCRNRQEEEMRSNLCLTQAHTHPTRPALSTFSPAVCRLYLTMPNSSIALKAWVCQLCVTLPSSCIMPSKITLSVYESTSHL